MRFGYQWAPYVPVAKRRADAARFVAKLTGTSGRQPEPVKLPGKKLASTFWGQAWNRHLEKFSDFSNRLPRGRTYLRNGSVIDLQILPGQVQAWVSGSQVYEVRVEMNELAKSAWKSIVADCASSIDSLFDLLAGQLDEGVMRRLTDAKQGLFPQSREMRFRCSCPDYATMCKHVAAVLYGVGARLDEQPQLLFTLRHVDHQELVAAATSSSNLQASLRRTQHQALAGQDLSRLFGIELESNATGSKRAARPPVRAAAKTRDTATPPAKPRGRARAAAGPGKDNTPAPAADVSALPAKSRRGAAKSMATRATVAPARKTKKPARSQRALSPQGLASPAKRVAKPAVAKPSLSGKPGAKAKRAAANKAHIDTATTKKRAAKPAVGRQRRARGRS